MKKIVGILAAAAVLATSVFAAEVSAGVRLAGSLFNYDGTDVSALKLTHENQFYHAPIAFSISDDKAGGTLKLTDKARGNGDDDIDDQLAKKAEPAKASQALVTSSAWQIWFKPVDALKLTFGCYKNTLNQESIGWYRSDSGIGDDGGAQGSYVATIAPVDGVSVDLLFGNTFGSPWFNGADNSVAEFGLMFKYSADFGTIGALFDAKDTFKDLKFGASFAGSADAISYWINVLGYYKEEFTKVRAELFGAYSQDALSLKLFVPFNFNVGATGANAQIDLGAVFRLDYAMDSITVYLEAADNDFLADDFSMSIKPGIKANVGCCAIDLGVNIGASSKVTIDVPLELKVTF